MTALCSAFPMSLSSSSRNWVSGCIIKVSNARQTVSVNSARFRISADRWRQPEYPTSGAVSTQRNSVANSPGAPLVRKAFASYTFYKGKGALSLKPGKPAFRLLDSGAAAIEKEGYLYLEFAPAVGVRQYDWTRKQIISLSVVELGTLLGLAAGEDCEFSHDPFMGKSDAGKIRKVLKATYIGDPGSYFTLDMSSNMDGIEEKVSVTLTRAEYFIVRSSLNFIIPYLMGWHMIADPSRVDEFVTASESNGKF